MNENTIRSIVESAGGRFVQVRGDTVYFRDGLNGPQMSLYLTACRSVEDVALAIKESRERIRDSDLNDWPKAHAKV